MWNDPTNLQYFILHVWEKIQKTGCYENSPREAGAKTNEGFPPAPWDGVRIVSELSEEFEWQHSTEERDCSHGEQCDHLLCVQTFPHHRVCHG